MKRFILITIHLFIVLLICAAQSIENYKTLDYKNPIQFCGTYIIYHGDTIHLGPKAFFVDGQLSDEDVSKYKFVYNTINKAAQYLTDGSEESPMTLYIAPYVYWIDDPDDPEIRVPMKGDGLPYGLRVECEWLRFYGLTDNPHNVILACNRGQTIGAKGNFTMFKLIGQGTSSENITFGNYCNVDLEYPLKPELNRKKRASAIVQAQLIHCNGDKILARNTHFVSRLNLCPFVGGKRVLFDRCHFESTDDALCGTGVYLNCTLDFYSSKPFYSTHGTGAVFLNCDITSFVNGDQYFTKAGGQLAVVDTRIKSRGLKYLGWQDTPPLESRGYQYSVLLNSKPVFIGEKDRCSTVEMNNKEILNAYRIDYNDSIVYNTYNLLRGDDDWDPMCIKDKLEVIELKTGKNYSKLPTQLLIDKTGISIETEKDSVTLSATTKRFGNYIIEDIPISWSVGPEYENDIKLITNDNGSMCTVVPTNHDDDTKQIIINASTTCGLKATSVLQVLPSMLSAPEFISVPSLSIDNKGILHVYYKLDMKYEDQSIVTWYRCDDSKGANPIKVAVSRFDKPLKHYELTIGDVGYYMMATIEPKHMRCNKGKLVTVVSAKPISNDEVKTDSRALQTDFSNFPTDTQPEVIPGFWSLNSFEPIFAETVNRANRDGGVWTYGEGVDGAKDMIGLLPNGYVQMFYTPCDSEYGDMKLKLEVAPFKTAGQGFSIAHLYMDILIKFDVKTLTGYGLRFIRTTKHHDAVDCYLLKYDKGEISEISYPTSTTCYRTPCFIEIEIKDDKIIVHSETTMHTSSREGVSNKVEIEANIVPNHYGGFGIRYAGGSPALFKELNVNWD